MLTGSFVLEGALLGFLWIAIAGCTVGAGQSLFVARMNGMLTSRLGEEASSQMLLSLTILFGAYICAEAVHGSGILASVAAVVTSAFTERQGCARAATRRHGAAVCDTLQHATNGVVFVLLGGQLPAILSKFDAAALRSG